MGQEGSVCQGAIRNSQSGSRTPGGITPGMGAKSMQVNVRDMDTTPELTLLAHDPRTEAAVPDISRFDVLREPPPQMAQRARNIFVIVSATDLPAVSEFVSAANRRHQLRAL